jgi:protein-L-isoaspartate O-methyltransferase
MTPEEVQTKILAAHRALIARQSRWVAHCENRISYERAMLEESGGTAADKTTPEKGGGCRCWCSPGHGQGWSYIVKVNKVSVTVLDNWGNGGRNFTRTMPFDKLRGVMSAAEVEAARAAGTLVECDSGLGFYLLDDPPRGPRPGATEQPKPPEAADFEAMKGTLEAGVQVVTAPQLFPTPAKLAARMVDAADLYAGMEVLEPSAGTGALIEAMQHTGVTIFAVEINHRLCELLSQKFTPPEDAKQGICRNVLQGDFLECDGNLGLFDRVVMNPPFQNGDDIKHIKHALTFLKPGGRLVAICAGGPRQKEQLEPLAATWEELPAGTFEESGTGVNTVLLVIDKDEEEPRTTLF